MSILNYASIHNRKSLMKNCSFLFSSFLILVLSCHSPIANVLSQLYPTANLSTTWAPDNALNAPPMLLRETKVGVFTCTFICEARCTSYIVAVVIYGSTDDYLNRKSEMVVWSANSDHPVGSNAILNLTADGELVLKDVNGSIVWTTNTTGKAVAGMNLTDTGNLVLFSVNNSVVWQSFDHPTDCLVPGQKLFKGQKLISKVSVTNSSQDMYYLQLTDDGLIAYVESNPPQAYYYLHIDLHVNDTNNGGSYIRFINGSLPFFVDPYEADPISDTFIHEASSAQFMKLMPNGHLEVFEWQSDGWKVVSNLLTYESLGECAYPLFCGRNSICSTNQECSCPITKFFSEVNERHPKQGCSEVTPLTCNSTQHQDLITVNDIKYFLLEPDMLYVSVETCKQACLDNCSCKAAFYESGFDAAGGSCFLPSEIFTMTAIDGLDFPYNFSAFIKVQNVTSPPLNVTLPPLPHQVPAVKRSTNRVSHKVVRVVISIVGGFVLLHVMVIRFIRYKAHKHKRDAEMDEDDLDQLPGMPTRFYYEELTTATENFSKKLGEGGFGSVYEGSLKDGSKIAVKCLEGLSHIKRSFLAEVQSIGSIHHVNLVRLRGFCTWKSQRFLVYDFMSNGSLDRWIYHGVREHILEWECRKTIILDIAKGLAYLHEECRQKIVHLDIKPQNILLDNDFNAKVSDFGLSKLIDKNQTQVMSTIKGTPGYIAPEWRSSVITEKVDVYSFGIVLLEILCGRRIFDRSEPEESWYLLSVFQKCWEQGTLLDMVDKHSEDMQVHKTEVVEMMKVASWCLQTNFKRRPSMPSVVKVLEGGMNVEPNLDYYFTDLRTQDTQVVEEKDYTQLSSSLLSGPR